MWETVNKDWKHSTINRVNQECNHPHTLNKLGCRLTAAKSARKLPNLRASGKQDKQFGFFIRQRCFCLTQAVDWSFHSLLSLLFRWFDKRPFLFFGGGLSLKVLVKVTVSVAEEASLTSPGLQFPG